MSHNSLLHHISFKPIDPLGDGLREDILAEQMEPEAIVLEDVPSSESIESMSEYIESISADLHNDNYKFSED